MDEAVFSNWNLLRSLPRLLTFEAVPLANFILGLFQVSAAAIQRIDSMSLNSSCYGLLTVHKNAVFCIKIVFLFQALNTAQLPV